MCCVQRLHLPNLKRNHSENLIINLAFDLETSPLFLQLYSMLTLVNQGCHFKGTGCIEDQNWMMQLMLMHTLSLYGSRTDQWLWVV